MTMIAAGSIWSCDVGAGAKLTSCIVIVKFAALKQLSPIAHLLHSEAAALLANPTPGVCCRLALAIAIGMDVRHAISGALCLLWLCRSPSGICCSLCVWHSASATGADAAAECCAGELLAICCGFGKPASIVFSHKTSCSRRQCKGH